MKIRGDIIRCYQTLHTWTGITTAAVLFIAFYAGALTMFKPVLNQWATPPSHNLTKVNTEVLDQLVIKALDKHPEVSFGFEVTLDTPASPAISPLTFFNEPQGRGLNLNNQQWQASLDQQGELVTQMVEPSALAYLVDLLHQTAGIPGQVGHEYLGVIILGIASVLYFLAIVSGVIILLPTMVKTLFALRHKKGRSRFILDSHNLLGITSLPFHIIICLTAIVFALHDPFYDSLEKAVYGDKPMWARQVQQSNQDFSQAPRLSVEQLIAKANQHAPDHQVTQISYPKFDDRFPVARLNVYEKDGLMRGPITDYVFIHIYSGEVVNSSMMPGEDGMWMRIVSNFFALHFGSYGGEFTRWVYFFLGLAGAVIFITGNLLWIEKKAQNSLGRNILANSTVGICIGSIAALSITMVTGKWLYPIVDNINYWYLTCYYSLFIAAVGVSFYLGAKKAMTILLKVSAIACLMIPMTSLLGLFTDRVWTSPTLATLMVDLFAIIFALVFLRIAPKTQKQLSPKQEQPQEQSSEVTV